MKVTKLALAVVALVVMVGLSSCSKTDSSSTLAPVSSNSALMMPITESLATPSTVTDATTDNSFAMVPPIGGDNRGGMGGDDHGGMGMMGNDGLDLGRIIKELGLSADVAAQIKTLNQARIDCQKPYIDALRASEKVIIDAANAARQLIMDDLKAGTITRAEAEAKLKTLRDDTQAKLDANPVAASTTLGLQGCEDTFLAAVGSLLTADQKVKWDAYLLKLKNQKDRKVGEGNGRGGMDRGGFEMGHIFRQLALTADQTTQVKAAMQAKIDCQKPYLESLRAAEKVILDDAKAQRQVILDALKAGTITRDEATTQLKALRDATQVKLDAARAEVATSLQGCEDTFLATVGGLLTPDQKVKWDAYLLMLKNRPHK